MNIFNCTKLFITSFCRHLNERQITLSQQDRIEAEKYLEKEKYTVMLHS